MNKIILDNYLINYQVFFKDIKHMYLRIENGQINISCNKKVKKKSIEAFLKKKKAWILTRLNEKPIILYSIEKMYLWGKLYPIKINLNQKKYLVFKKDRFVLNTRKIKKNLIENYYKTITIEKAKTILKEKSFYSNYITKKLIIKSQLMKTRLGSCINTKKIIKLNSILSRFSCKYLEMVLYHELAHLKVNNHSKSFYKELNKLYPNYKNDNNELKKFLKNIHY